MKIKKLFFGLILFSLLIGSVGIQQTQALGTPQIIRIDPSSPAQVGACIAIRARVDWDSEFRSMRIRFGNEGWQESSEIEFERNFCTENYSPGWYTIRVEAARQGDNSWGNPSVAEAQYELTGQPKPSRGPAIDQFNFNPSGEAEVGDPVNIHIRVDSNNPGATKINVDCGDVSKIETSEVEFNSTWNTAGCPAETVGVLVCSRTIDDPDWSNSTCSSRSYTLSYPQIIIPVPTAQLWADNEQISKGQCTNLHWQTSSADRVEIDGNIVDDSGTQQICPTVTKKFTLRAENESGSAARNFTVLVSDQPAPVKVVDHFQTGDIIQIGTDLYVIVNGERRLVPNPDTLDALGISRVWVNNKGVGESELKTIPLGQDIPDVNSDPAGFAAFKNSYFQNTNPINLGVEPTAPPVSPAQPNEPRPSSGGPWQIGARVGLCSGAQIRQGSGFGYPTKIIVPEQNWQVDIIGGPRKSNGVTWWDISREDIDGGGTGWVYYEQAGKGNCGVVLGDSTENPVEPTQPDAVEPDSAEPKATETSSSGCGLLVPCAHGSETLPPPKTCQPGENCGFFDIGCRLRNFWLSVTTNRGCTTNSPSSPLTPLPVISQVPDNDQNNIIIYHNKKIPLGEMIGHGDCVDLARALVSFGSLGGGANEFINNSQNKAQPLKSATIESDKCYLILFRGYGIKINGYDELHGHTAVLYTNNGDSITVIEQHFENNPMKDKCYKNGFWGACTRTISSTKYDNIYILEAKCP
jgi:hypothetical protein